jgi:succinate dehydrogenase / fumarate reductase cytochrome b subunit
MGLNRKVGLMEGLRYQGKGPMLTYILHRIGGLSIIIFVGMHVLAAWLANHAWGTTTGIFINRIYENWLFQVFIFFCVLFHVINGLRIVILDLFPKLIDYQREAIWLEWLVFLPIYSIALYVIIRTGLGG